MKAKYHARGEDHGAAKLTERIVRLLRERYKLMGYLNCAAEARRFGVSEQAIWFAVKAKGSTRTWRHVK